MHFFLNRLFTKTTKQWIARRYCQCRKYPLECDPDLLDRGICAADPCDASICYPQPKVVIVGAGVAGLSAAARLVKRGITNFTVLEAYERPGGRIQSCWFGDVIAELGSNWSPDNSFTHPIFKMSATEKPPRPGVPATEYPRGLLNKVVPGEMDFPMTMIAYHKFRQIEKEAAQIYCLGGDKQHGSLLNFMSIRIQQEVHDFPQSRRHDAARIMFGLVHMIMARCGSDTGLLCSDEYGCFMNIPGSEVRVPLGLVGSLAPMLCEIPEGVIKYCKPVDCIYWGTAQKNGHRVIVCTTDGTEYPADYALVTVSLGVLQNNAIRMFCPALPASKMDAMRNIGFGCCNKIFLEYCRPFWFWHKGEMCFKFNKGELSDRCDWTRGIKAIEPVTSSKHVICVWLHGNEAMMMEGYSDNDVVIGVTDVLRWCSQNACIPYPKCIIRSNWSSDPYFYGAYSYEICACDGEPQRELATPLPGPGEPVPPMLFFGGEATVPGYFATVAGAHLSGIREAERIVQLTVRYKGPPKPCDSMELYEQIAKKKQKTKKGKK